LRNWKVKQVSATKEAIWFGALGREETGSSAEEGEHRVWRTEPGPQHLTHFLAQSPLGQRLPAFFNLRSEHLGACSSVVWGLSRALAGRLTLQGPGGRCGLTSAVMQHEKFWGWENQSVGAVRLLPLALPCATSMRADPLR